MIVKIECRTHGAKDRCGRTGRCVVCCAIREVGERGGTITDDAIARQVNICRRSTLSRKEVAERIGVAPGTLSRYALPEPDAWIGETRGWRASTIDAWNAARPGRGKWGK
mgnify:CR=1 FL=1